MSCRSRCSLRQDDTRNCCPQCTSVTPNGPLLELCGLSAGTALPAHIWLPHPPLIFDTAIVPSALFAA